MSKRNWLKASLLMTSMMTMMAGAVVSPSLPQITEVFSHIEHNELLVRLIVTGPALFIAFVSPFAGYIIDQFGRKRLLQFSLLLYCAAGTTGFYVQDLYLILAGRVFLGFAVAGILTTVLTLVGDYFEGEERSRYIGLQSAFIGLGGVVFITLAGFLADIHWQHPFLIYAFSLIIFIFDSIFLYEPKRSGTSSKQNKGKRTSENKKIEYPRGLVWLIYFIVFLGMIFFFMYPVQIPYLLRSVEGVSNAMVGYAISGATLTGSILAMNYRRIKKVFSFPMIYGIAFFLMGAGYFVVSFAESYSVYIAGLIISGSSTGLLMPTGSLWIISIAPQEIRGRLIGRLSTAFFVGQFFSPIFVQPVIQASSLNGAFMYASFFLWAMSITFVIYCFLKKCVKS